MKILIVLGKRLNNDGSFHQEMLSRCNTAANLIVDYNFDIAILSGGLANPKAPVTEAQAMFDYLTSKGIDSQKLVLETNSKTTYQNAKYTVPMLLNYPINQVHLCTSPSHLNRPINNPIALFKYFLRRYSRNIQIIPLSCKD